MAAERPEPENPKVSGSAAAETRPPTLNLPPRTSFETLFTAAANGGAGGGGYIPAGVFSPGPMTLMSNFLSDPDCRSFSQLLAGAIGASSPMTILPLPVGSVGKEPGSGDGFGSGGYKVNRPVSLVVGGSSGGSNMFMVPPGLSPSGLLSSPAWCQSPFGMSHQQALAHVTAQAALSPSFYNIPAEYRPSLSSTSVESLEQQQAPSGISDPEGSRMELVEISQPEQHVVSSLSLEKPASDGYNWRKYGQKQVKASECPRSYYRCTHDNCPVKKQVGRSPDGKISDIVYKGQHNHEPPPPKRTKEGTGLNEVRNSQAPLEIDWQPQSGKSRLEEGAAPQITSGNNQVSTQLIHLEKTDDVKTRLHEGGVDEPNPKRRNTVVEASSEFTSSLKAVTESKIIVQTRSEVDLLDDGYKWRKYGQKVVKGNTHPRSYYKCTYSGCSVRKQVERASSDPKAVVTTYEGKHNHDIPVGRNRSNSSGGGHQEMDFGNDQRPALLQLKEEQIKA